MRWGSLSMLVASLAMALGLMLPATAAAAGPARVFELQGSNGYRIGVLAGADRAGRGGVEVFVGRGHSSARYGAEATVTDSTIDADLGALGAST